MNFGNEWNQTQRCFRQNVELINNTLLVYKHKCLHFSDIFVCFRSLSTARTSFAVYCHSNAFETRNPLFIFSFPHKNLSCKLFKHYNSVFWIFTKQKTKFHILTLFTQISHHKLTNINSRRPNAAYFTIALNGKNACSRSSDQLSIISESLKNPSKREFRDNFQLIKTNWIW